MYLDKKYLHKEKRHEKNTEILLIADTDQFM